jgi:hypothetical protein
MLKFHYAAFLVFGCAANTIGPMLPSLAEHVALTPVQMAPLLTAKGFGGLFGSFVCPLLPLVRVRLRALHHHSRPTVHASQAYLMPGGLLAISASFATIPAVTSLFQLALVYSFAAVVYQAVRGASTACATDTRLLTSRHRARGLPVCAAQVSVAAHTLIAQQYGEHAGPHLNGINALFGAGSLLAPALHRTLSPVVSHVSPLGSYWVISAAALLAAGAPASAGHATHPAPSPLTAKPACPVQSRSRAVHLLVQRQLPPPRMMFLPRLAARRVRGTALHAPLGCAS